MIYILWIPCYITLMIADIIPTKKLPRSLSALSYLVPENLSGQIKVGQLVTIPLRGSFTTGVVANLHSKRPPRHFTLKYLTSLASDKIVFTNQQIQLFSLLSKYYLSSASLFVHYSLPKILPSEWPLLPDQLASRRVSFRPRPPHYFWWATETDKYHHYQKLLLASGPGQVLIVVPKITDISALAAKLDLSSQKYLPVHSDLPRAAYFHAWLSALNNQKQIFIGTRSACFLPFSHLRLVIVDNEHSPDHKQYDLTPRYEVSQVCENNCRLHRAELIFSSPTPSLAGYYRFHPKSPKTNRHIELADLRYELENKNYTFLSDLLTNSIAKVLSDQKNVFLFLNKKGAARSNRCADCGHTFLCPTCSLPLVKQSDNRLACYYCQHFEDLPPFCPVCGGPNFQSLGLGTQKIATYLRRLYPSHSIAVLDSSTSNQNISESQIVVGTEFALDKIDWPKFGLVSLVNADELWYHSEFLSNERAYQTIISLLTRAPKNAKLIIQTFSPESALIRSLITNNPREFYQSELLFREKFRYPPFVSLVKISIQNHHSNTCQSQAKKLYQKLVSLHLPAELSEPFPIARQKIRGRFKYNLILKTKDLPSTLSALENLPSDILIDVNPQTLLD